MTLLRNDQQTCPACAGFILTNGRFRTLAFPLRQRQSRTCFGRSASIGAYEIGPAVFIPWPSFFITSHGQQDRAQMGASAERVWHQRDGMPQMLLGLVQSTQPLRDHRQIGARLHVIRIEFEQMAIADGCVVEQPLYKQCPCFVVAQLDRAGLEHEALPRRSQRTGVRVQLDLNHAQRRIEVRMGMCVNRTLEPALRSFELVRVERQ
jgi:hypothetical protein